MPAVLAPYLQLLTTASQHSRRDPRHALTDKHQPYMPHPAALCCLLQNELAVLELIHCFVEVLDKHFGQVCELDIMNDPDVVSEQHGREHAACMMCGLRDRIWASDVH